MQGRFSGLAITIARQGGVALGLGVLFAWLGVYGTGEVPFLWRALYWASTMAVGIVTAAVVVPFVFEGPMKRQPVPIQILTTAALVSVPITGLVVFLFSAIGSPKDPLVWASQYAYVFVISILLTIAGYVVDRLRNPPAAPPSNLDPAAAEARGAIFRERLPIRLRQAEIWAVSAEDHYLRVHTSAGEELILMRLSDAIRELGSIPGMRTHRSWWVSAAGVAEMKRDAGKVVLKLKSGREAPVSRTYQPAIREMGWS
ncbi:hypothetical protein GC169_04570 [bacterium]|nr:hypothetical protein [bacterium]